MTLKSPVEIVADMRPRLVALFRWRRHKSPEDLAQETIVRALRVLDKQSRKGEGTATPEGNAQAAELEQGQNPENGKPGASFVPDDKIEVYVMGIARRVLLEAWRDRMEPVDPAAFLNLAKDSESTADESILVGECLDLLDSSDRKFIVAFHSDGAAAVAKRNGTTSNAVRIRACRIHKYLQERMRKDSHRSDSLK